MMNVLSFARRNAAAVVAGALLAACGSSLTPETGVTSLSAQRMLALTMPHYHGGFARTDRGKSWMKLPDRRTPLLYADADGTNDTYVFAYPSGKLVGTLTGFDAPYGMCVDQRGDVYISNYGNGELLEYAHGAITPMNTYTDSGGSLIGCSVSAKGDLAATAFESSSGSGRVCIWKGGKGSPRCVNGSEGLNCYYLWTFGYDPKGDLVGEGEYNGVSECMIPAGKTAMETLSSSGITIEFAGGTQWDGKYFGLGDQEYNNTFLSSVQPAKLTGTTLRAVGSPAKLANNCGGGLYLSVANPFFSGKTNITAASTQRATDVSGPSYGCSGAAVIGVWKYPAGGAPVLRIGTTLSEPYSDAISIAE